MKAWSLCVSSAVIVDGFLWFCSNWYGYLFKCNLKTNIVEMAIELPKGNTGSLTIPYMFSIEDSIYMVANNLNNNLIRYNISRDAIDLLSTDLQGISVGIFSDEDEDYVYLPVIDKKQIVTVHKSDLKIEMHQIDCQGKGVQLIKKVGKEFVILETEIGDVVITDDNFNIIRRYENKPEGFKIAYNRYYPGEGIICCGDEITIIPRYANMIYSVNVNNGAVCQIGEKYNCYENENDDGPRFSCVREMMGSIWIFFNKDNKWILFDNMLNKIDEKIMTLTTEVEKKISSIDLIKDNNGIFYESKQVYNLVNFMNSIKK